MVVINSDETWQSLPSAVISSEFYDGEVYDDREETGEWSTSKYDTGSCMGVKCLLFPSAQLIAPDAPPVRITQKLEPIEIITSPTGKTIIDFGQNLVGVVQIRSLKASLGHKVSLVHVEVLEDGKSQLALCATQNVPIQLSVQAPHWSSGSPGSLSTAFAMLR